MRVQQQQPCEERAAPARERGVDDARLASERLLLSPHAHLLALSKVVQGEDALLWGLGTHATRPTKRAHAAAGLLVMGI
jgi:hypothetical protein